MPINIQDEHFTTRYETTKKKTYILARMLEWCGHWKIVRFATSQEDQEELIDIFVEYPKEPGIIKHIQFKIRTDPKYKDFIIARIQPLYNGVEGEITDDPKLSKAKKINCNGRDWRSIMAGNCDSNYIATQNASGVYEEISYVSCDKLLPRLKSLDEEWADHNKFKFTTAAIKAKVANGKRKEMVHLKSDCRDEVWWQHNVKAKERPKFLMYIENSIRDGYVPITKEMLAKWDEFANEYQTLENQ